MGIGDLERKERVRGDGFELFRLIGVLVAAVSGEGNYVSWGKGKGGLDKFGGGKRVICQRKAEKNEKNE